MRVGFSARVFVVACIVTSFGCAKSRPPWPEDQPDINTLRLTETGVEASPELAKIVRVETNRLVLPAAKAEEVKAAWPVGKSVIGAPSSMPGTTNPLGFLRKVKEVRVEGDNVIVETEPATLVDVVEGELRMTIDADEMTSLEAPGGMDLEPYLPQFPTDPTTPYPDDVEALGFSESPLGGDPTRNPTVRVSPVGVKRQPLDLTATTISTPSIPLPIALTLNRPTVFTKENGQLSTARMQYRGALKVTPTLSLTPRLRFDVNTKNCPFCELRDFLFSVGGSISANVKIDGDISIAPNPEDAASLTGIDLKNLDDAIDQQPVRFELPDVTVAKYAKKVGTIYGVPVVLVASVNAECQFKVRGDFKGSAELGISNPSFVVGAKYQDSGPKKDRLAPVVPDPFSMVASGSTVNANGTLEIECGLTLKTALTIAELGGPYVGLKNMLVATNTFSPSPCTVDAPAAQRAQGVSQLDLKAYSEIELGGEISLLKIITVGVGPFSLGRKEYAQGPSVQVPDSQVPAFYKLFSGGAPLYRREWLPLWTGPARTFQRDGVCPSLCTDGVKNNAETDLDCGGNCGATCTKSKACTRNEDCLSRICSSGSCRGSLSDDDTKNQGETDVDCGGPNNPNRCNLTQACTRTADCAAGFCATGSLKCSDNLCEDAVKSGTEGDIDCGNSPGCVALCQLGQSCNDDLDCTSRACSVNRTCVADKCVDGLQNGTETGVDCGGTCPSKCANGAGCEVAKESDCASGFCSTNGLVCVASRCQDGRFNQDETDIDCGGTTCSARCAADRYCALTSDCQPGSVCSGKTNRCVMPGCGDGLKNLQETGIDCGGPTCAKCGLSKGCASGNDCGSGVCSNNRCVSSLCDNESKDTGEADVDCGGTCGQKCATGKTCTQTSDCQSNICVGNRCISDACLDRVRNGTETDVDCGGTCAADCAVGKTCSANADCTSALCSASFKCVGDACSDGVKNNTETDVDCGGSCATKCAVNKTCSSNADCGSAVCNATSGRCVPDTCFDGVKNNGETDLDCGGPCQPKCGVNKVCAVGTDCQSGTCTVGNTCAADQCSDARLNGNESDVDCGGTCATKCAVGSGCASGSDCINPGMVGLPGYCSITTRTCTATSCGDGVKDGDESGVDCGGSCAAKCAVGQGCVVNADCSTAQCNFVNGTCAASACGNGRRDPLETDIDCGGSCGATCAIGQGCAPGGPLPYQGMNCASGYCTANLCSPRVPLSCLEIYNTGVRTDGPRQVDMDGPMVCGGVGCGGGDPHTVYCDMTGGGWTLVYALNQQWATSAEMQSFGRNTGGCPAVGSCAHPSQYAIDTPQASSFATRHSAFGLAPPSGWTTLKWEGYTAPGVMRLQSQVIPRSALRFSIGNGTNGYGYIMWGNPYYWLISNDNWLSGAWTQPAGDAPVPLTLDEKTVYWGVTFGNGFSFTTISPKSISSRGYGMWGGGPNGAMGMCNTFNDSCLFLPGYNGNYQNIQDSRLVQALWAR